MRLHVLAFAVLSGLASCQTAGTVATTAIDSLATVCQRAQDLLSLPGVVAPSTSKIIASASRLSSKVALYCTAAQIAAPVAVRVLNDLNTTAAGLLGTGVAKPK